MFIDYLILGITLYYIKGVKQKVFSIWWNRILLIFWVEKLFVYKLYNN